jgi:DNA-binding NarL/FixJ family response regulator
MYGGFPDARAPGRTEHDAVGLTAHEEAVAALVAAGMTNVEIADELRLSPKTIEARLTRIYRKLGLRSRTELALRMVRR